MKLEGKQFRLNNFLNKVFSVLEVAKVVIPFTFILWGLLVVGLLFKRGGGVLFGKEPHILFCFSALLALTLALGKEDEDE